MAAKDAIDPVADDEEIYRRIPESLGYWDGNSLASHAFRPGSKDVSGISVVRAKYCSSVGEAVLTAREGKSYFIAVLRVAELRKHGIEVVSSPTDSDPGHAELPGICYATRKEKRSEEWQQLLATKLTLTVEGPFVGGSSSATRESCGA